MRRRTFLSSLSLAAVSAAPAAKPPLRVGVAGTTHGHVNQVLRAGANGAIEIVGVAEPNRDLAKRLLAKHDLSPDLIAPSLDAMLRRTKPEAVAAYNAISEHREVVETCAPQGIHVMVEKPLAFSVEDGRAMEAAAKKGGIHLITNYETTWYGALHEIKRQIEAGRIGDIRKIVVRDGHPGPREIGVMPEFFEWLTDPTRNGAGALVDFGCYGADIAVWLMGGKRPTAVKAMAHTFKPHIYPRVDDEATILLEYSTAQVIIQASWNWPFNRKDMAVYGQTGYLKQDKATLMRERFEGEKTERNREADAPKPPEHDAFAYLTAVVRGEIDPAGSLSGLDTNVAVVEILDAARKAVA